MTMERISNRLKGANESATLRLNALVQTLKAQGKDIVNLTAGEPDFFVHEAVKKAQIDAVLANQSKYTPVAGIPELKSLVAQKTNSQQPALSENQKWKPSHVAVTNGAKQALYNFFMATLNEGDEVIIPSPYWLSYPEMVKLAGGVPRIVETSFESGFKITPDQLKKSINSRTKVFIINSPSNPTGVMYSKNELSALGEVLLTNPIAEKTWVLSDEIYDLITFGSVPFCSFLNAAPKLRDRTVTVNGLSKSAAMTGWRIGWSVGPEDVTQAMLTLQGQCTSGINAPTQWAGIAALKLNESEFTQQAQIFKQKRDILLDILTRSVKLNIRVPDGAFYAFVGVEKCLKPNEDSAGFAERLLQEVGVAVVPGEPFGAPTYVRLSYATDEASLKKGCERFLSFVQ